MRRPSPAVRSTSRGRPSSRSSVDPRNQRACARDVALGGEQVEFLVGEQQVRLAYPQHLTPHLQARHREGQRLATRQDDVAVARQRPHQVSEQLGARRARGDLVDVVDQQRHLVGRAVPHRLDDAVDHRSLARRVLQPGRPVQPGRQRGGDRVIGRACQPRADAPPRQAVLVDGLGQQRCLPQTGRCCHHCDRQREPLPQPVEQARTRQGRPAARTGLLAPRPTARRPRLGGSTR